MKKYRWFEVIRVGSPAFLVSSKRQACRYETADGKPLATGTYLALWPAKECPSIYGASVCYFGPLTSLTEANLLITSARALGFMREDIAAPRISDSPEAVYLSNKQPSTESTKLAAPPFIPGDLRRRRAELGTEPAAVGGD